MYLRSVVATCRASVRSSHVLPRVPEKQVPDNQTKLNISDAIVTSFEVDAASSEVDGTGTGCSTFLLTLHS